MTKPVVLCILDGWGISDRPEQSAPDQAATTSRLILLSRLKLPNVT